MQWEKSEAAQKYHINVTDVSEVDFIPLGMCLYTKYIPNTQALEAVDGHSYS